MPVDHEITCPVCMARIPLESSSDPIVAEIGKLRSRVTDLCNELRQLDGRQRLRPAGRQRLHPHDGAGYV